MQIIFNELEFKERLSHIISEYFNSDKELSLLLNVQRKTVNNWRNQVAIPKVQFLAQISLITGISLDQMVLNIDLHARPPIINERVSAVSLREANHTFKRKNLNFTFNEQEYKDRLTEILNLFFKNNSEAANRLGTETRTINYWKKQTINPPIEAIVRISTILNLTLNYIVLGREPKFYKNWN